jgi:hypothetical protein
MNPITETSSPVTTRPFLPDYLPRVLPPVSPPPPRTLESGVPVPRSDPRALGADFPALTRLAAPAYRDLLDLVGLAVPAALLLLVGAAIVILAAAQ